MNRKIEDRNHPLRKLGMFGEVADFNDAFNRAGNKSRPQQSRQSEDDDSSNIDSIVVETFDKSTQTDEQSITVEGICYYLVISYHFQ